MCYLVHRVVDFVRHGSLVAEVRFARFDHADVHAALARHHIVDVFVCGADRHKAQAAVRQVRKTDVNHVVGVARERQSRSLVALFVHHGQHGNVVVHAWQRLAQLRQRPLAARVEHRAQRHERFVVLGLRRTNERHASVFED
jgi:hypothetical protein